MKQECLYLMMVLYLTILTIDKFPAQVSKYASKSLFVFQWRMDPMHPHRASQANLKGSIQILPV